MGVGGRPEACIVTLIVIILAGYIPAVKGSCKRRAHPREGATRLAGLKG